MKRTVFRAMPLLVCLAGMASAACAQVNLIVVTDPNQLSSTSALSANRQIGPNLFVVDPSFTSIRIVPPGYQLGLSTQDIFVSCFEFSNGTFHRVPNCIIQLAASRVPFSGGHQHGDPNGNDGAIGVGSLNPTSGTTGAFDIFQSTFTASEASGTTTIEITAFLPDGTPLNPVQVVMMTQIHDQLVALPNSGPGFSVDTSTNHDNQNVWLTPSTMNDFFNLVSMFQDYVQDQFDGEVAAANLELTATNLPLGGIFDIAGHWLKPHVSHRFGRDLDIGTRTHAGALVVPRKQRAILAAAIVDAGFTMPVAAESYNGCSNTNCDTESHHWHVRDGY